MADGRTQNGGARAGAGRKTKAEEDDLQQLLKKCVTKDDRVAILVQLVADSKSTSVKTRQEARKLLMAYLWGKPVERHEVTGAGGKDLIPTVNVIIEPPTPSQAGSGPPESGD